MASASQDLCNRFVALLPVSAASISITSALGGQSTIGISDSVAARLEQLQFELREGPHWEVLHTDRPVLVSDTHTCDAKMWPMFRSAIAGLEVGAIFALPLKMGAVTGIVAEQLQRALQSRVLIEQAKGALAQISNISFEDAFAMLRKFARDNSLTLTGVCEGVMGRTLEFTNSGAATTVKMAGR